MNLSEIIRKLLYNNKCCCINFWFEILSIIYQCSKVKFDTYNGLITYCSYVCTDSRHYINANYRFEEIKWIRSNETKDLQL